MRIPPRVTPTTIHGSNYQHHRHRDECCALDVVERDAAVVDVEMRYTEEPTGHEAGDSSPAQASDKEDGGRFLIGGDALRVDNGVVRFITDGGDQSDLPLVESFEALFSSLVAAGKPVLVIALPFRADELQHIQQSHPGGVYTSYNDNHGQPSYLTYELLTPTK